MFNQYFKKYVMFYGAVEVMEFPVAWFTVDYYVAAPVCSSLCYAVPF
jgi:hypothetical protein